MESSIISFIEVRRSIGRLRSNCLTVARIAVIRLPSSPCVLTKKVAAVDSARIDQINIYQASRLAMLHAVHQLTPAAGYLLVDAVRLDCELPQQPIIHGDALSASIAAASILAKVERDRMISAWDPVFPMYGLASNKGYCTPRHLAALCEHGPSPLHRQSFSPVWSAPIPQEVLGFMLDESAPEVISSDEEPVPAISEG